MMRFGGKVAVVAGGNSGIGLAPAKAFAREGAPVVIMGRDEAPLKAAEWEIGAAAIALRADVSRLPEIDGAMASIRERFKKSDALFVNAGIGKFVPFDHVTEEFFDETLAVNLKGAFSRCIRCCPCSRRGPHRPAPRHPLRHLARPLRRVGERPEADGCEEMSVPRGGAVRR
jgi:NAD(P)-dependent dehydrogenase (short-subunit alcohol dehydrogenase family)